MLSLIVCMPQHMLGNLFMSYDLFNNSCINDELDCGCFEEGKNNSTNMNEDNLESIIVDEFGICGSNQETMNLLKEIYKGQEIVLSNK